ncbi:MAG: hypothetical protein NTW00_08980 [Hyphomicrobiales bacterium]|jgi:hypothetical protein|nr:hypothetical protein [Hyphomicrobiales bacterium]
MLALMMALIRHRARLSRVLLAAGCLVAGAAPVQAQLRSEIEELGDCEKLAVAFSRKHGGMISAARIERGDSLAINRFDDKVGSQRVSTEYVGFVRITEQGASRRLRFICLHEGGIGSAVYFGLFYE